MSGLYAFALLSGRPRGPLGRGFGRESLRLVRCAGLLVTVSRLPATPATSLSALRRHDAVVRRLVRRADGVLPFRFGTFVDDRPTLARRLSARAPALRRALSLVAGREQMTLRVYGPPARPSRARRPASRHGAGARYLATRLAAARRRRSVPELAPLRAALGPFVVAERAERHDHPPLLASVYHLVERGRSRAYRRAVTTARARLGRVTLSVSGPWPPYAFAPDEAA